VGFRFPTRHAPPDCFVLDYGINQDSAADFVGIGLRDKVDLYGGERRREFNHPGQLCVVHSVGLTIDVYVVDIRYRPGRPEYLVPDMLAFNGGGLSLPAAGVRLPV
jgi:hypothetical protein